MSTAPYIQDPTFMDTNLPLFANLPHKVADLSEENVRFGRKELELALALEPANSHTLENRKLAAAMTVDYDVNPPAGRGSATVSTASRQASVASSGNGHLITT